MNFRVAQTCGGDSHEDIVVGLKQSDFQILAHFAKCPATVVAAQVRGWTAKLAAEGIGEVAVAREAEFESELSEIIRAIVQTFERSAKA
jgi:hypothetical protein